ncbi:MAG TPA: peptidoglycan-associated lipoprotein Pal [Gemmatimonadales bacterium]|jgi:peptidoglycan-associated lipoprotein|nr:peptidoglycan-associated lipoprotein Pal [Gemmatimonadales bacterium]
MKRISGVFALMAATALAAACGGAPAPEQPAPVTSTVDSAAIRARQRQDSIDEANRRRAEEEARRAAAERDASAAASALRNDMNAMIHFDYNVADIRSEDQAVLDRKAAILQANTAVRIRISGHADERGSDEYNLALGNRRAAAAKRYLMNRGVDGSRIDVISYGEERPIAMGGTEDAYAQNRRDEFEMTAGGDSLVAPQ